MQLETFWGRELHLVVKQVREALGDDAMIVQTRVVKRSGGNQVEVVAARPQDIEGLKHRLDGGRAAAERAKGRKRVGPYVVALVGPAGAGKTTTAMKIALHPSGVGRKKVGLLTLDTYRVGALEELQTYAEIADLPLEAVYRPSEVPAAMQRLRDRDVVIVDTPGRGFGSGASSWVEILEALDPDEIHLVVPAGFRPSVATRLRTVLPAVKPTHILISKLDEVGSDPGLVELAEALDLPTRWVASSPEIPGGLEPASTRILAALGVSADEDRLRRAS